MKEIIAICNRRGGTGKTCTTFAIGTGLSQRGYKVLFIDLDSQGNLTYDLGVTSSRLSSMEVLTGTATVKEAIVNTKYGDLLTASPSLSSADTTITETGKEYRLREALEPVLSDYDYVVIDNAPSLGILTVNSLTACNSVIIPVQAEVHSIKGIALLNEAIEPIRKYCNPGLKINGILITRYTGRAVLSKDMKANLEEIANQLNTKVYRTPIRECISMKEAEAMQQDIYSYAPSSNVTKDYNAVLDEFLEQ